MIEENEDIMKILEMMLLMCLVDGVEVSFYRQVVEHVVYDFNLTTVHFKWLVKKDGYILFDFKTLKYIYHKL